MDGRIISNVLQGLVLVILLLLFWGVHNLRFEFAVRDKAIRQEIERMVDQPQTLEHSWVSGGLNVKVTTPRNEGESAADHSTRHKGLVDAALVDFPPDGGGGQMPDPPGG